MQTMINFLHSYRDLKNKSSHIINIERKRTIELSCTMLPKHLMTTKQLTFIKIKVTTLLKTGEFSLTYILAEIDR